LGHEWVPERYGKFATLQLDELRLSSGSQSKRRAPVSLVVLGVCFFIGVENAFSPFRSGGEARVGRSSPHLEGRNEVENRNEACVMEVAAMGSRAKLRTKEGGK
jgi:hypothetical protein